MAEMNSRERRKLEQLLGMGSGYVLDFSDRTYSEFFQEFVGKDIDHIRYRERGTSKANRLRAFWDIEPNYVVAKALTQLIEHARDAGGLLHDRHLLEDCQMIIARLEQGKPVADIDAIAADGDKDFELVAGAVRESIDTNQPELGLDRLHTFVVKFFRQVCTSHGLPDDRSIPLNGLVGGYVKHLREQGHLASEMTERVMKSSISNLEAFNHVRNNHSLAHDNPILPVDEALLILNHVASTVRFVKALESRIKPPPAPPWVRRGEVPF